MREGFERDYKNHYGSFVSKTFYGTMETNSQCSGCNCIKYNFQIYSFLEFSLQQVNVYGTQRSKRLLLNPDGSNPDVDLDECWEYYSKTDLMNGENQMYCNFCNRLCDSQY